MSIYFKFGIKEVDGGINVEGKGIDILSFDTEIVGNLNSVNIGVNYRRYSFEW